MRDIDALNYAITVEAGVILADVQTAAEADRYFPLSLGGEGTARIGGNLSTNAGGTGFCVRTAGHVPRSRSRSARRPIWNGLTGLRKDNTGYDLKHLFIGAEGTLVLSPQPAETLSEAGGYSDRIRGS